LGGSRRRGATTNLEINEPYTSSNGSGSITGLDRAAGDFREVDPGR
jgi:hypothetical protein